MSEKEKTLAVREGMTFSTEEISTIKNTVAKDATDSELKLFLYQCKRTGLDPFSRQIYFFKIGGKASIGSSIDGFRLVASRSKEYQGQTIPQFLDKEGKWHEVWTGTGYPVAAKVGVHRRGFKEPLYAISKWDSYAPVYNGKVGTMWAKMPDLMLAKVAEALALRKAFPNDLSGLYTSEEMTQAGAEEFDTEGITDDTVPTVHVGDDHGTPPPNMMLDGQAAKAEPEIPADELEQKKIIVALVIKKWPKVDYKDAKAIKTAIADYTELELVPQNYPSIIKALR